MTVRYQTAAGERIFSDGHTTAAGPSGFNALGIPLYNANSTYVIRITAVLDDGKRITSNNYTIPVDEFVHMARNGMFLTLINYRRLS